MIKNYLGLLNDTSTLIGIIGTILSFLGYLFREKIFDAVIIVWHWLTTWRRNSKKLKRTREAVSSPKGLWLAMPLKHSDKITGGPPNGYDVTTIANLKGGVGKTTISANLIGHCAKKRTNPGQSVLGIDFDYQGSMTSMALPNRDQYAADGDDTRAGQLISGNLKDNLLESAGIPHATEPRAKFIPSNYPFAQVENRMMVQWLIDDTNDDLRFRLVNQFTTLFRDNSPIDKIIIDAPPRLTTGAIQALCASSRIIIPTVMDRLSTKAVGRFINQIYDLRQNDLCPYLKEIWVIGTIISRKGVVDIAEHQFLTQDMQQYRDLVKVVPFELCVPDNSELSRQAGHRIAYLDKHNSQRIQRIRDTFDNLGNHIWG